MKRDHWHLAAHRCELAAPGDYVLLPWGTDGEAALANMAGELVAFDNRCPHRGARIYSGLCGNREPRCAYHGRLATANSVQRYAVAFVGDWVFVGNAPIGFRAKLALAPELFDFLRSAPALTPHSAITLVMDCDWRTALENALDFDHVAHVHGSTLAKLGMEPLTLALLPGGLSIEHFSVAPRVQKIGAHFPHTAPFGYAHAHISEFACLSSTGGWTYSLQHYMPRADGRTDFVHRLYTAKPTRPMGVYFDAVAKINEAVFREDAEVCARIPIGHTGGTLAPHERRIAHFRAAFA